MDRVEIVFHDRLARRFAVAALAWGVVALAAGLGLAVLRLGPIELPAWASYGRVEPLHTGAALWAFVGNLAFAAIYHSSQRLLIVRAPERLGAAHFWLWQLTLALGAATVLAGHRQAAALAELEWPLDLALAAALGLFAAALAGMIRRRRVARLPVALWFYLVALIGLVLVHVVGNLARPTGALTSSPWLGGVAGALLERWTAHGTTELLLGGALVGAAYWLVPAASGRPLRSYRLALVHLWSLALIVMWAAPQHLLNTALPDRLQILGVVAGLCLLAPGLALTVNGLGTLAGAWQRLRVDPVLKFLAAGLLWFGLAAIEATVLALPSVASLADYTAWRGGHAHLVGLGWAGAMAAALLYYLVPRLFDTELRWPGLAGAHFYLTTVAVLVHLAAMVLAGATEGLMLRAHQTTGALTYDLATIQRGLDLPHLARAAAGALYLLGFLAMAANLIATMRRGRPVDGRVEAPAGALAAPPVRALVVAPPVRFALAVGALVVGSAWLDPLAAVAALLVAAVLGLAGLAATTLLRGGAEPFHARLEQSGLALATLLGAALVAGSAIGLGPAVGAHAAVTAPTAPPPVQRGRELYVREGCLACHTQMVRPFTWEVARYGEVSRAGASGDGPALWGTRRVGPDLARVGARRDAAWLAAQLVEPRRHSPGSVMPSYRHLADDDRAALVAYLRTLGAPGDAESAR